MAATPAHTLCSWTACRSNQKAAVPLGRMRTQSYPLLQTLWVAQANHTLALTQTQSLSTPPVHCHNDT